MEYCCLFENYDGLPLKQWVTWVNEAIQGAKEGEKGGGGIEVGEVFEFLLGFECVRGGDNVLLAFLKRFGEEQYQVAMGNERKSFF